MKSLTASKLILAAALALGLGNFAAADTAAPAPASTSRGLLGQSYVNLGYHYVDVDASKIDANAFDFAMNQSIRENVDTLFEYSILRSEDTGVGHITSQQLLFGGRYFTNYNGIKPYAEAGIGWQWDKVPTIDRDNSFAWFAGVGAEFQVMPELTLTPFVRLTETTAHHNVNTWDYGIKANYWLTEKVGLALKVSRDDDQNMSYGVGVNWRF